MRLVISKVDCTQSILRIDISDFFDGPGKEESES